MALRDSAIVGHAETKFMAKSDRDAYVLAGEVMETLLEQTGLEAPEIDGFVVSGMTATGSGHPFWAQHMTEVLGLEVGFCEQVHIGGCSAVGAVARAAAAIDFGMCDVVLLMFVDTPVLESHMNLRTTYRSEWTEPYGLGGPPSAFGLLTKSYETQHGLDYAMLGKLAVTQRSHAMLNDNACEKLRVPITIDDYLESRMIADPIRLLDCVMPADGAAGLLMMSRRTARRRGLNSVIPLGYAEVTNYKAADNLVDVTRSGHERCGPEALTQAGVGIGDIASFHPYDDFIIAIMLQLEAFGFCEHGQGSDYVREHDLTHTGDLPLNTGGGQISAGQAAACSHNLIEAVRQLRGDGGNRQIANTENALVSGIGWINYGRNWGSSAALVLAPE